MFHTYCTTSIVLIEIFNLFETEFIRSPTILVCPSNLFKWKKVIVILILQIILIYDNDKWQYRLTVKINILDYNDPFSIARLYGFSFPMSIVRYHNKDGYDLAYEKAGFIEIPDIVLYNIIFGNYILEKPQLFLGLRIKFFNNRTDDS